MKPALWLNINTMMMVMRKPLIDLYFIYFYLFKSEFGIKGLHKQHSHHISDSP